MFFLEKVFLNFFKVSLSTSIIILIVFFILKVFKNISVRIKYTLCMLLALRLLFPVIIPINININSFQNNNHTSVVEEISNIESVDKDSEITKNELTNNRYNNIQNTVTTTQNDVQNNEKKTDILKTILYVVSRVWALGCSILLAIFLLCSLKFKTNCKKYRVIADEMLEDLKNRLIENLKITKNIPIFMCEGIKSPCILGLINTKIYMPKDIYKLKSINEVRYIILHELMHYKRKDLIINLFSTVALIINWYNPLVWMLINRIKLYREYACDAGVLEYLGEDRNVDYGMTLINFSKVFLNKNRYSSFAMCFETNNTIGERIKMIKGFKKGSYKISSRAALGCLVATVVIFSNGSSVKALNENNLQLTTTTTTENTVNESQENSNSTNNQFLIDSNKKVYGNINKVKKVAGFDFKLPDYAVSGYKTSSYQVIKNTDGSNVIEMYFSTEATGKDYKFDIFNGDDPVEALKATEKAHGAISKNESTKVEANSEAKTIGGIEGNIITLQITNPEETFDDITTPEYKFTKKYFVWKNDGINYSIMFNEVYASEEKEKTWIDINETEVGKIAQSLKDLKDIKNVKYKTDSNINDELSTELGIISIYDKEDLGLAKEKLGFNPKMPLEIGEDFVINDSGLGINSDSDTENNKINFELSNIYINKDKSITFTQSKHDSFNKYNEIKTNGYATYEDWIGDENKTETKKAEVEKVDMDGHEVYKYKEITTSNEDSTKEDTTLIYMWEEDGVYNTITMFNTEDYQDDLAKEFVSSKPIE